jgi:hypothetical protein
MPAPALQPTALSPKANVGDAIDPEKIPANHKWFRNLAVSQIIADTMDEMGLKLPPTHVDIADIRRKYHAAEREEKSGGKRRTNDTKKAG